MKFRVCIKLQRYQRGIWCEVIHTVSVTHVQHHLCVFIALTAMSTQGQVASNAFAWLDYLIFVTTIVGSLAIGVYHAVRKRKDDNTVSDYLVASRKLHPFPVAVSLTVSYISSIAVLGNSSEMHYYGATYAFYIVGHTFGIVLGLVTGVPLFHSLKLTSINEVRTFSRK